MLNIQILRDTLNARVTRYAVLDSDAGDRIFLPIGLAHDMLAAYDMVPAQHQGAMVALSWKDFQMAAYAILEASAGTAVFASLLDGPARIPDDREGSIFSKPKAPQLPPAPSMVAFAPPPPSAVPIVAPAAATAPVSAPKVRAATRQSAAY